MDAKKLASIFLFFHIVIARRYTCVIARRYDEAIFPHVMLSEVEASTFSTHTDPAIGSRTDPSTSLRMT